MSDTQDIRGIRDITIQEIDKVLNRLKEFFPKEAYITDEGSVWVGSSYFSRGTDPDDLEISAVFALIAANALRYLQNSNLENKKNEITAELCEKEGTPTVTFGQLSSRDKIAVNIILEARKER